MKSPIRWQPDRRRGAGGGRTVRRRFSVLGRNGGCGGEAIGTDVRGAVAGLVSDGDFGTAWKAQHLTSFCQPRYDLGARNLGLTVRSVVVRKARGFGFWKCNLLRLPDGYRSAEKLLTC
jgi:hypothetical protein